MQIPLYDIKQHLHRVVDKMSTETLTEQLHDIKKTVHLLETLQGINALKDNEAKSLVDTPPDIEPVAEQTHEEAAHDDPIIATNEAVETEQYHDTNAPVEIETSIPETQYIFQRKMSGGTLEGIPDSHIAESIVRQMDLQTGDVVHTSNPNNILGDLRLIRKRESPVDDPFTVYPYCTVKQDGSMYYVDEYYDTATNTNKKLRLYDTPYTHYIEPYVMDAFKLNAGDIIDIAVSKTKKPNQIDTRIAWKHTKPNNTAAPKAKNYKKKTPASENTIYDPDIDFQQKHILVVGLDARRTAYENIITKHNGQFQHLSGEEQMQRIKPAIKRADAVILLRDQLTHDTVKQSIRTANRYNVPVMAPDKLGLTNLLVKTKEVLDDFDKNHTK